MISSNDWTNENYSAFDSEVVDSKVMPRWKRKALERANASTTSITSSSLTSSPSRSSKRKNSGTPHVRNTPSPTFPQLNNNVHKFNKIPKLLWQKFHKFLKFLCPLPHSHTHFMED